MGTTLNDFLTEAKARFDKSKREAGVHDTFADHAGAAAQDCLMVTHELAWAAECELATVEHMEMLKRPPKSELERHRRIADRLMNTIFVLHNSWSFEPKDCPRVAEKLKERTS